MVLAVFEPLNIFRVPRTVLLGFTECHHIRIHWSIINSPVPLSTLIVQNKSLEQSFRCAMFWFISGLEVGPQPQGVLRSNIFESMRMIMKHALDFIELFNNGKSTGPAE